jgi:hypothetical protein
MDDSLRNEIMRKIENQWPPEKAKLVFEDLERALEYSDYLSVYRLESGDQNNDIDVAILRALLKAKKDNYKAQLKLSLTWNRVDIASNYIFTSEKNINVPKISLIIVRSIYNLFNLID